MKLDKLPKNIDDLSPGKEMNIFIERLVFEDAHWVQGWDTYREVPDFSGDIGAAMKVLEEARKRIKEWAEERYGVDVHLPGFELKDDSDGYYCRIGINIVGGCGKTIPEAICKAAYRSVASHVLKDSEEE